MALFSMKQQFPRLANNGSRVSSMRVDESRSAPGHVVAGVSMEDIMVRKTAIALTAAVVIAGSPSSVLAMHGGGGGHGGMGHGGFAAGFGHAAMAHPGGLGGFAAVHPMGMHGARFAVADRFHFRHRFDRNRFAFIGAGWPYYDDCYTRVWTPWGWRWNYVCY
jgi:hypothetical protein